MCQNQLTRGPWSQTEYRMHINCVELLAATLAVHTFLKDKTRISVLLRLDITTAVAYINNLGGTVSKELVDLAKDLWMWCLKINIYITAQHLPCVQNQIAQCGVSYSHPSPAPTRCAKSTTPCRVLDYTDWKLNSVLFWRIVSGFGLFASSLTTQCPFMSCIATIFPRMSKGVPNI